MNIIDWNPTDGDLSQGDVLLFRVPDSLGLGTDDEIRPCDHKLVLAEGEVTGHQHAIWLPQLVMFRDDGLARDLAPELAAETTAPAGTARLYRDPDAVRSLVRMGELAHERGAIGFLVVEAAPVLLRHDEHDAVRIPPGRYYVGGQTEWDAAEERRVMD